MWWPINPYSGILLLSLFVAVGTAILAWRTRPAPGSYSLTALQAAVVVWLGAHVLEIESSSFPAKLLWVDVQWLAAAVIPTCFLVFALEYTGTNRWLTRRRLALLTLEPIAMIAILLGRESLLWEPPYAETISFGVSWAPPATVATAEPNLGLLVHLGYATLCLAVASSLVLDVIVRNDRLYRWQGVIVLVAIAVPWATAVLSVSSLETIGTTPIGFTITGLAITFGLYRYRLLELTPIARHEVVTNLEDGVIVVDDEHRIVDCNPVARELFGSDRSSLVGVPVAELVPDEVDVTALVDASEESDTDDADRTYTDVTTSGSDTTADDSVAEPQFSVGDGPDRRHYALSWSPIDDGRGRPAGWTIVVHDVTDRVRRERELERANRKLDEFAGVVSHDLRNPLSVSRGYLELLESEYDPEYVRRATAAHDRMEHLIEDVLTLARQGPDALDPEPVALEAVATAAWTTVDTADATLSVADDRTIRADRTHLQQLLENLFRNAVEHGSTSPDSQVRQDAVDHGSTSPDSQARQDAVEHGSTNSDSQTRRDAVEHDSKSSRPRTDASSESDASSGERCARVEGTERDGEAITLTVGALEDGLYVADSGSGFQGNVDRIFEPGYSTGERGTGLGLAIVADIVDLHGWSITATDADSGGARFEITGVEFVDEPDVSSVDSGSP